MEYIHIATQYNFISTIPSNKVEISPARSERRSSRRVSQGGSGRRGKRHETKRADVVG